jgi:hypothetical protein
VAVKIHVNVGFGHKVASVEMGTSVVSATRARKALLLILPSRTSPSRSRAVTVARSIIRRRIVSRKRRILKLLKKNLLKG